MFKMYGNYKYDLDKDIYIDNDNNTLEIFEKNKRWIAKFSKDEEILEDTTYESLEIKIENFIYSRKTKEEIIHTYYKPPVIKSLTQEQKKLIKEINKVGK